MNISNDMNYTKSNINNNDEFIPWSTKYIPTLLQDIVGNKKLVKTLTFFVNNKICLPNLFFYGSPGTGKSCFTRVLVNEMCKNKENKGSLYQIYNASYESHPEELHKKISDFSQDFNLFQEGNYNIRYVIIDDITTMDQRLETIILDVINTNPKIRFLLIGNQKCELDKRLLCSFIEILLCSLLNDEAVELGKKVLQNEHLDNSFTSDALLLLYCYSSGDIRKYLNLIQHFATTFIQRDHLITVQFIESLNHSLQISKTNAIEILTMKRQITEIEMTKMIENEIKFNALDFVTYLATISLSQSVHYFQLVMTKLPFSFEDYIVMLFEFFDKQFTYYDLEESSDYTLFCKTFSIIQMNASKVVKFKIQIVSLIFMIRHYCEFFKQQYHKNKKNLT